MKGMTVGVMQAILAKMHHFPKPPFSLKHALSDYGSAHKKYRYLLHSWFHSIFQGKIPERTCLNVKVACMHMFLKYAI